MQVQYDFVNPHRICGGGFCKKLFQNPFTKPLLQVYYK